MFPPLTGLYAESDLRDQDFKELPQYIEANPKPFSYIHKNVGAECCVSWCWRNSQPQDSTRGVEMNSRSTGSCGGAAGIHALIAVIWLLWWYGTFRLSGMKLGVHCEYVCGPRCYYSDNKLQLWIMISTLKLVHTVVHWPSQIQEVSV